MNINLHCLIAPIILITIKISPGCCCVHDAKVRAVISFTILAINSAKLEKSIPSEHLDKTKFKFSSIKVKAIKVFSNLWQQTKSTVAVLKDNVSQLVSLRDMIC